MVERFIPAETRYAAIVVVVIARGSPDEKPKRSMRSIRLLT